MKTIQDTFLISRRQLVNDLIDNDFVNNKGLIRQLLRVYYTDFDDEDLIDHAREEGITGLYDMARDIRDTEDTMRGPL